jgi:hypothetical protein
MEEEKGKEKVLKVHSFQPLYLKNFYQISLESFIYEEQCKIFGMKLSN